MIIECADTPLKRIGLILISTSLLYWGVMAVHWNIYRHGFIYSYWTTWTEETPKPEPSEGEIWLRIPLNNDYVAQTGWGAYNKACLSKNKPVSILDGYPLQCRKNIIPDNIKSRRLWNQSFTAFIDNLFVTSLGGVSLFLVVLGLVMFSGLLSKCLRWIESGKLE